MQKSREDALKSLKKRITNAKSLIICDPYILSSGKGPDEDYVKELVDILPETLETLALVHSNKKANGKLLEELENAIDEKMNGNDGIEGESTEHIQGKKIEVHIFENDTIHDRVWIIDSKQAFVTGTSFNSIGYQLSFILKLDKDDFLGFFEYLKTNLNGDFVLLIEGAKGTDC